MQSGVCYLAEIRCGTIDPDLCFFSKDSLFAGTAEPGASPRGFSQIRCFFDLRSYDRLDEHLRYAVTRLYLVLSAPDIHQDYPDFASIAQSYRAIPLISDPLAYPITGASRLKKGNVYRFLAYSFLTCSKMPLKIEKNS